MKIDKDRIFEKLKNRSEVLAVKFDLPEYIGEDAGGRIIVMYDETLTELTPFQLSKDTAKSLNYLIKPNNIETRIVFVYMSVGKFKSFFEEDSDTRWV